MHPIPAFPRAILAAAAALATLAAAPAAVAAPPTYQLVDLGRGEGLAIDEATGDAVGYVDPGVPARWHAGVPTLLPGLDGAAGSGWVRDVNASGTMVGQLFWGGRGHAALWRPDGSVIELKFGSDHPATVTDARRVNRDGWVIATFQNDVMKQGGIKVLDPWGVPHSFPKLPGGTYAQPMALSDANHVTGYGDDANHRPHCLLWSGGVQRDLGAGPSGLGCVPYGVNDAGHVVGHVTTANYNSRPFLWRNGSMKLLGTLGGAEAAAVDVNAHDWVIGWSDTAAGNKKEAPFLYMEGRMHDLASLLDASGQGWTLASVERIGDDGSIVGSATRAGEPWLTYHAIVLKPIAGTAATSSPTAR